MENKTDHPGVYIPPPLIYVLTFLAAIYAEKIYRIDDSMFHKQPVKIAGIILLVIALFFLVRSLRQFLKSKNTLVTIKPSTTLESSGIYNITRNPMYVGLAIVYLGITCLVGNWWNIILFPLLLLVVQEYIIKSEEKYLERRYGQGYLDYKLRVRRWL
jgi:protein-S-isoprenylcysteine O-methyltransferase Ste14